MACAGIQIKAIEFFQFTDSLQIALIGGALSIERVQNDALKKIAESNVVVVGEGPQDFQKPLFHADTRLDALNDMAFIWMHGTKIPR